MCAAGRQVGFGRLGRRHVGHRRRLGLRQAPEVRGIEAFVCTKKAAKTKEFEIFFGFFYSGWDLFGGVGVFTQVFCFGIFFGFFLTQVETVFWGVFWREKMGVVISWIDFLDVFCGGGTPYR